MEHVYHASGSLSKSTYEGCTLPSLQLNLEGGKLFCLTEDKSPLEWPGNCRQHLLYLEVVVVLLLSNPFHALYGVIFYTNKYEDKSNFIFLLRAGIYG